VKLSEYRQVYYELSGKASDVSRNLAFAGIAVIWLFKVGDAAPRLPVNLMLPLVLFCVGLAFDLLQYVAGVAVWGLFQWHHDQCLSDVSADPELDAPSWFNWPALTFFVVKLTTIASAYVVLSLRLWSTLI
jgi:hypothetical protein